MNMHISEQREKELRREMRRKISDDDLLEEARKLGAVNLIEEAREAKKAARRAEKEQPIRCPHCNEKTTVGKLRHHVKHPRCVAAQNRKPFLEKDMRVIGENGSMHRICQVAGIETLTDMTYFREGRKHQKGALEEERWAPGWVTRLFNDSLWRLAADFNFTEAEAVPYVAEVVRQAKDDQDIREALFGASRAGGNKALGQLIFTGKVRAAKLRREAAEMHAAAAKKETEADELDPPETASGAE